MLGAQGLRKLTELISVTKIVNGNPEMWTQDWVIPLWLSGILLPEGTATVLPVRTDAQHVRWRGDQVHVLGLGTQRPV